jgi:hypothetical protein
MPTALHDFVAMLGRTRGAGQRSEARVFLRPEGKFRCNRGKIVDFSPRGMRLRGIRRFHPEQVIPVRLLAPGVQFELAARCIWSRRQGMASYVAGFAFERLTSEQTLMLRELTARYGIRIPFEGEKAAAA